MRCVSNTAKTSVSSGVTWNSQSRALGPGGDQAASSDHRTSDKERPTAELAATVTWHDELMAAGRTEPQEWIFRTFLLGGLYLEVYLVVLHRILRVTTKYVNF